MSKKADIWMPLYLGDYLASTTHLSAELHGGYLLLLMHQWKNGSLPADVEALRRIARIELNAWSNAWAVLELFFDFATGVPVQLRLEKIREEWTGRKAKNAAKATHAAKVRWKKDAPSNAQAMLQTCPSSSSSSSKKDLNTYAHADGVERVYQAYPRKVGKGKAIPAIQAAVAHLGRGEDLPKMTAPEALAFLHERVTAYARSPAGNAADFTPHPATWFNRKSYLDDVNEWNRERNDGTNRQYLTKGDHNQRVVDEFLAAGRGSDQDAAGARRLAAGNVVTIDAQDLFARAGEV